LAFAPQHISDCKPVDINAVDEPRRKQRCLKDYISAKKQQSELSMAPRKKMSEMSREEIEKEKETNEQLLILKGLGFVAAFIAYTVVDSN